MLRTPSPFAKPRPVLLALALTLPLAAQAADAPKASAAAPAAAAAANDPVVAKVNNTVIHLSDVLKAQHSLPQQYQSVPIQQIYPRLVDKLVDDKLLVESAKAAKVTDDAEYKERLAALQEQVMTQVYIHKIVDKAATSAALHALYDKMVKTVVPKDEVHAHHILVASEDEAKAIIAQLDKGGDFAKIAYEKTTDKSGASNGGDLGWFSKDQMVPDFANAAFGLKKGEYTKTPVHTQFGWHVILADDQRKAPPPTFEQAKGDLTNQIAQETIQKTLDELRKKAKIEELNPDGSPVAPPAPVAPPPTVAAPVDQPAAAKP